MENLKFTISEDLLATKGQRFINFILDLLIVHTIIVTIATTVVLVGRITTQFDFSKWIESTTFIQRFMVWIIVLFLYYFLTETYYSRTFAKYFTNTIVVKKDGSRPRKRMIFIRTLTRFIPIECLTFLSSNIRGLHDMFSNTYVVKKQVYLLKKNAVIV